MNVKEEVQTLYSQYDTEIIESILAGNEPDWLDDDEITEGLCTDILSTSRDIKRDLCGINLDDIKNDLEYDYDSAAFGNALEHFNVEDMDELLEKGFTEEDFEAEKENQLKKLVDENLQDAVKEKVNEILRD